MGLCNIFGRFPFTFHRTHQGLDLEGSKKVHIHFLMTHQGFGLEGVKTRRLPRLSILISCQVKFCNCEKKRKRVHSVRLLQGGLSLNKAYRISSIFSYTLGFSLCEVTNNPSCNKQLLGDLVFLERK